MGPLASHRYRVHGRIGAGGVAVVDLGTWRGGAGFTRAVALKRLHAIHARDPELVGMLLDEARIVSRVRHVNVVPILDVQVDEAGVLLVFEYVHGESLVRLLERARAAGVRVPSTIAAAIAVDVLHGIHAAHEATDEEGVPLGIIHRDVSPSNVLVGADGVARVVDFGIAFATRRVRTTMEWTLRGTAAYMAPEQVLGEPVDRRADVWAAAVVLWECLTGERPFAGNDLAEVLSRVALGGASPPSAVVPGLPPVLDVVTMRALDPDREARYATALDMARAIEAAMPLATRSEVREWVLGLAGAGFAERCRWLAAIDAEAFERSRVEAGVLVARLRGHRDASAPPPTGSAAPPARAAPSSRRAPALLLAVATGVVLVALVKSVLAMAGAARPTALPASHAPAAPPR